MQEHPVPQNITSYEFHLIGNMTLKQFFELGVGGVLAFMTYSTNLPDIIKWPLVILFVLLGVAFAFIPLEERPLDHWFLAFIRAIYNPTRFYWKKAIKIPELFDFVPGQILVSQTQAEEAIPRKRSRAEAYFNTISSPKQEDDENSLRASAILSLYDSVSIQGLTINVEQHENTDKPSLQVEMHKLHAISSLPPEEVVSPQTLQDQQSTPQIQPIYTAPLAVPKEDITHIQPMSASTTVFDGTSDSANIGASMSQILTPKKSDTAVPMQTNANLPFPKTPTIPNLVVGMVLDLNGKMVEQSIIEIRDHTGMPVRALRSNKLGQFFVSTPLPSGEYELVVEKDNYTFDTMKLTLSGGVVSPVEVRAKAS